MNALRLSQIYRSGDLPFRPRWLARLFVIRKVRNDAVLALGVAEELDAYARLRLRLDLESYRDSELRWLYHEAWGRADFRPLAGLAIKEVTNGRLD